jgi:nitrogen fixation protein FixH
MNATDMLLGISIGILAELLLYLLLRRVGRMGSKPAAVIVALAVLLIYIPRALLDWPGADVFAIHLALYLIVAYILGIVGHRQTEGRGWHWAPALIIVFFAFVVGMNVVFLGVAEQGISGIFAELLPTPRSGDVADSRFPGTVARDYQKKEALYNAYLQQVEEQHQRGWQVRKGWQDQPYVNRPAVFLVTVVDAEGVPVSGADIQGEFLRTSNSAFDRAFTMVETAPGEYRLDTQLSQPGLWRLVLKIRKGEALHEIQAITSVKEEDKAGS